MKEKSRTILVHVGLGQSGSTSMFSVFDDSRFGFDLLTPRASREEVMYSLLEGLDAGSFKSEKFRELIDNGIANCDPDRTPVISSEGLTRSDFFQSSLNLEVEAFAHRLKSSLSQYDIKILLVVREQRSLFISKYRKYVEKFGGNLSLNKFVRTQPSRQHIPIDREHLLAGNFNYSKLHDFYSSLFGDENVLTLPMEMMKGDPAEFLGRIATLVHNKDNNTKLAIPSLNPHGALGLTEAFRYFNKVYSPISPSYLGFINPSCVPDINHLMIKRRTFSRAFFKIRNFVVSKISAIFGAEITRKEKQKQYEKLDALLGKYYAKSNSSLSNSIGVSLSKYGYKTDD